MYMPCSGMPKSQQQQYQHRRRASPDYLDGIPRGIKSILIISIASAYVSRVCLSSQLYFLQNGYTAALSALNPLGLSPQRSTLHHSYVIP